jgi:hypothetical protein
MSYISLILQTARQTVDLCILFTTQLELGSGVGSDLGSGSNPMKTIGFLRFVTHPNPRGLGHTQA